MKASGLRVSTAPDEEPRQCDRLLSTAQTQEEKAFYCLNKMTLQLICFLLVMEQMKRAVK